MCGGEGGGGVSTVLLHDLEELDDDFARRTDQDLSLACFFGIVLLLEERCRMYDVVETVVQDGNTSHDGDVLRFLDVIL